MELKKKIKSLRRLVGAVAIVIGIVGLFGVVVSWLTGWDVIKCSVGVLALFVGAVIWRMFSKDFLEEW